MAYVPPALRRKQEAAAKGEKLSDDAIPSDSLNKSSSLDGLPSVDDIQRHFWPNEEPISSNGQVEGHEKGDEGEFNNDENGNVYTVPDSQTIHPHSTLNGTAEEPGKLKYVLLFTDANPRWKSGQIIFVKTDLHLLPNWSPPKINKELTPRQPSTDVRLEEAGKTDEILASRVMIFEQGGRRTSGFTFIGYYSLIKMDLLEPKSPQLAKMLEQKFTRTNKWGKQLQYQRDATKWEESLSKQWAVLKFEKDEEVTAQLSAPEVKTAETRSSSEKRKVEQWKEFHETRKSVSEMLRDMPLKDGQSEEAREEHIPIGGT